MHLKVTKGEMGAFSSISYLVGTFEQKATRWFVVCSIIWLFFRSFILICQCAHVVITIMEKVLHGEHICGVLIIHYWSIV